MRASGIETYEANTINNDSNEEPQNQDCDDETSEEHGDYSGGLDDTREMERKFYKEAYSSFQQPDGGFGWVIVIAAFTAQFVILGTMNNFGILFTQLLEEFKTTKQEASWVGSITYGIMFATGPIATSLSQKVGCRPVAILGSIIGLLGTLLSSFCDSIFKMYLTQGFLFGVGASLCYFPSIIILPQYFYKKLSIVNGLVSCGSGVGTMAMAPLINYTIENYGWRASVRVTTVFMSVVTVACCVYRPLLPPRSGEDGEKRKKRIFDCSIFQNKGFLAFTFALSIFMLSYFVPFVHLTQMALEYNVPKREASLLAGIMSVGSTFGRLFFGRIADSKYVNRLYVYQLSLLGIGVVNTLCPLFKTFPGLIFYCMVFGFFEGCYVCQAAVITGDIVGVEKMASAVGVLFGIKAIPLTMGPPIAGLLYEISNSYEVAFFVAGAIPTLASVIMFSIPFLTLKSDRLLYVKYQKKHSTEGIPNCGTDSNNNTNAMEGIDQVDSRVFTPVSIRTDNSLTSINTVHCTNSVTPFQKKINMRELGSISSFGSVVFNPVVPPSKNNSTFLLDTTEKL